MSNSPNFHRARDFLATPHLSLSLAGIFRDAGAAEEEEVGEREERGRGLRVEMSSENSGPGNDDFEMAEGEQQQQNIEDDEDDESKEKKRKKYHRHTPSQIREMEALFKESPHPDEKQRLHLSKNLGLHPRQVKFWFQNRRTQIKAIQERHESSLLKTEIEKLRQDTKTLREAVKKSCCPNCGFSSSNKDATAATGEEQKLRIENAKLNAEVERLRTLWVRSYESGREMLNYDEYRKQICLENSSSKMQAKKSVEASRDSGVVFVDLPWLVKSFMDANQWK